ncbi:MAG: signal peptidase I [Gammaproteobacteria bacterium]|jgi:signal peptidase I|nr:signal peptidase I [Chromatiales bacterium]MCP4925931.1 signal peptidase I [Gammaproteobacteria bacterium]MDP7296195.1 signal peptidase I [Gammaproteobacteria bacterium]MDP7419611.1 signal peptidase I [Gammaproteobacteria bacterium]MDP7659790.1 signal peptidase I [Gammaproteobacteria bacterium]
MTIDFSFILTMATALCGLVWGLYVLWLRWGRNGGAGHQEENQKEPVLVEYARSFFPVLLIVLIVRSFLFEPFRIPSSSMVPTLLVGDFIFVNKFFYGLRLPVINNKFLDIGDPERGDVVVFRLPAEPSINYIKRLIGLPGDKVMYRNRRLYINGEIVASEAAGAYKGEGQPGALLYNEFLGEAEHGILLMPDRRSLEGTFIVPAGHYFMMGDNRDNSKDSRYQGVGLIPDGNIVGKAVLIWMNWKFTEMPRWDRIGHEIN